MANLTESPIYEPGIFQLEKTTPPLGGAPAFNGSNPSAGHANVQALQLANRTSYLNANKANSSDLADNIDPLKGAGLVGYDGDTVATALNSSKAVSNYTILRSYTGPATLIKVLATGISGDFYYDSTDTLSLDNGGTIIVSSDGRRWKRLYTDGIYAAWFGAKGNNINNDTTPIQAAIDYTNSIGGGVIKLLTGVHLVTGLTIYNDIIIEGAGKQATRIKLLNGANQHIVQTLNFDTLKGTSPSSGDIGVMTGGLKSLTLDGNGDNQSDSTRHGLAYFGIDVQLEDVAIKSCRGWGLWIEAPGVFYTPGGWYGYGRNSQSDIKNIEVYENWQGNFYYNGQSDSSMFSILCYRVRGVLSGITYDTSKPHATNMWVGPKSTGIRVFGAHFWGDSYYGLVNEANTAEFDDCHTESASIAKVLLKASSKYRGRIYEVASQTSAYAVMFESSAANFSEVHVDISGCLNWIKYPDTPSILIDVRAHGWVPSAVMETGTIPSPSMRDLNNRAAGNSTRRFIRSGSVESDSIVTGTILSTGKQTTPGGIDLGTSLIENCKGLTFNGWTPITASSATLTVPSSLSALTAASALDITDIVSSASEGGLIQFIFRNSGVSPITFKNSSTKLRNIGQVDKILNQHDSITYIHIAGTVWQQVAGK